MWFLVTDKIYTTHVAWLVVNSIKIVKIVFGFESNRTFEFSPAVFSRSVRIQSFNCCHIIIIFVARFSTINASLFLKRVFISIKFSKFPQSRDKNVRKGTFFDKIDFCDFLPFILFQIGSKWATTTSSDHNWWLRDSFTFKFSRYL